jgi:hypothetical protein
MCPAIPPWMRDTILLMMEKGAGYFLIKRP